MFDVLFIFYFLSVTVLLKSAACSPITDVSNLTGSWYDAVLDSACTISPPVSLAPASSTLKSSLMLLCDNEEVLAIVMLVFWQYYLFNTGIIII